MIVLKAEATEAVEEPLADDIVSGVLAPPLRVAAWDGLGFGPANALCLFVEEPRPTTISLFFATIATTTATTWGRRRTHVVSLSPVLGFL